MQQLMHTPLRKSLVDSARLLAAVRPAVLYTCLLVLAALPLVWLAPGSIGTVSRQYGFASGLFGAWCWALLGSRLLLVQRLLRQQRVPREGIRRTAGACAAERADGAAARHADHRDGRHAAPSFDPAVAGQRRGFALGLESDRGGSADCRRCALRSAVPSRAARGPANPVPRGAHAGGADLRDLAMAHLAAARPGAFHLCEAAVGAACWRSIRTRKLRV